jgi:hypothetical protein
MRLAIRVRAHDCNALASEAVRGLPSPLSAYLYLRALFAENKALGFGAVHSFAFGLRECAPDSDPLACRPLPVYQSKWSDDTGAIFDEDRCSIDATLVVRTDDRPDDIAQSIDTLAKAVEHMPFIGGKVQQASVAVIKDEQREIRKHLRGSLVYTDVTPEVIEGCGGSHKAMAAVLLANSGDESLQQRASATLGIPKRAWEVVNGHWYRMLPLGYRRISDFVRREDARPVKRPDGTLAQSVHAFVESVYGFVDLVGVARAVGEGRRMWWEAIPPSDLSSGLVIEVKGV